MTENNKEDLFNEIFKSFEEKSSKTRNLLDQEHRDPTILFELIEELDLIPEKNKVIRITGSKGKTTTGKIIRNFILKHQPEKKVGMFITPYIHTYNDQIQINKIFISDEDIKKYFLIIKPHLDRLEDSLDVNEYLAPYGIFLLIALMWFKEQAVDYIILELGRGVKYDEAGMIPSKYSLITNIMEEHLNHIGPTLDDVFLNKISIVDNSDIVFMDQSVEGYITRFEHLNDSKIAYPVEESIDTFMPKWYKRNYQLAKFAVTKILGRKWFLGKIKDITDGSFGIVKIGNKKVYFDGGSCPESIDINFLKKIQDKENLVFICSLPDSKEVYAITKKLFEVDKEIYHVILKNRYLSYKKVKEAYSQDILLEFSEKESDKFIDLINSLGESEISIYMFTSNKFIRVLKEIKRNNHEKKKN